MTAAEFLAWNPPSTQLWQLVDGEPQAMAPANRTYGSVQAELARLIANHLSERSSPCSVVANPRVIPRVLSETNCRISGLDAEESALTDPVLVIEILWPSNQAETWANVWAYATIPSVREILVIRRRRSAPIFSAATKTAPGRAGPSPSRAAI
jgi:Uma2 family endonuclease